MHLERQAHRQWQSFYPNIQIGGKIKAKSNYKFQGISTTTFRVSFLVFVCQCLCVCFFLYFLVVLAIRKLRVVEYFFVRLVPYARKVFSNLSHFLPHVTRDICLFVPYVLVCNLIFV